MPAGLCVAGLGERSLEGPGLTFPLYFFEGSHFQCFPGEEKRTKKKKTNSSSRCKIAFSGSSGLGTKAVSDFYVHSP